MDVAISDNSGGKHVWFTLIPIPATKTPSCNCTRIPAHFRPAAITSLGQRKSHTTPVAFATAQMAALFVKHFPREMAGVFPPEALPAETRAAILSDVQLRGVHLSMRITRLKKTEDQEEF